LFNCASLKACVAPFQVGANILVNGVNLMAAGAGSTLDPTEGHFNMLINKVNSGNYAIIEFGHNNVNDYSTTPSRQQSKTLRPRSLIDINSYN